MELFHSLILGSSWTFVAPIVTSIPRGNAHMSMHGNLHVFSPSLNYCISLSLMRISKGLGQQ